MATHDIHNEFLPRGGIFTRSVVPSAPLTSNTRARENYEPLSIHTPEKSICQPLEGLLGTHSEAKQALHKIPVNKHTHTDTSTHTQTLYGVLTLPPIIMYICVNECMCVFVCVSLCLCMCVHTCMCVCVCLCACLRACLCVWCACSCVYLCMCVL